MTWQPDSAFVISLARTPLRLEGFRSRARHLQFDCRLVEAVDRPVPPPEWTASVEAYGCARSHRLALATAVGTTVIMEDDALVDSSFQIQMGVLIDEVPPDWLVLKIGGQHLTLPASVSPHVVRCVQTIRTHAYVLRQEAISLVLAANLKATTHWDGQFAELDQSRRIYAPSAFIVETTNAASTIPDSLPYSRS